MELLRAGGSALDAVEAAVRIVEANVEDHYVGVGGLPNLLGVVELDAGIMDGTERRAGAVGAVVGFPNPITIARAVRDRLPQHLLLVGEGAQRFADESGIPRGETLTDEASELWRKGLGEGGIDEAATWGSEGEVRYRREALARVAGDGPARAPVGDGQRAGPRHGRAARRRGEHQRLPVEVPGPARRLPHRRRRLLLSTTASAARPAPGAVS